MVVPFGFVQFENLIEINFLANMWSFEEVYGIIFTVFRVILLWLLQDSLNGKLYNFFMGFLWRCDTI